MRPQSSTAQNGSVTSKILPAGEGLADQLPTREELLLADKRLAERCVRGEVRAWEEFHLQCHASLLRAIASLLRGRSYDANLTDEIAARVWFAIVANDGELLTRYDPARGARLITFLRAVARDVISRHFRSERRRMAHESEAWLERPRHHPSPIDEVGATVDDFLDTLSPSERAFCGEHLMRSGDAGQNGSGERLSPANIWQKTHRIYKQFRRFFGHDT